ncbi:MAG: cytochrome P450 [Acidimicrobiales bacterium]
MSRPSGTVPLPRPGPRAQLHYLRHLFTQPHRVLDEIRARHGSVVALGAGPARLAVVGDPATISDLFSEPTDSFRWNHRFNVVAFWVGTSAIIVSDGPDHRRRRAALQVGFSRRRLNGWIPMIVDATDAAVDGLIASLDEPGRTIDLYPVGRAVVLDVVVRALGGPHLARRVREIDDVLQQGQDFIERSAIRQMPHPFPGGARRRLQEGRRALDAMVDDEIARIRRSAGEPEGTVLEALVGGGDLSDAEIRDQVATLIGAGFDTTAATLAWTLLRATDTPGLWDRIAAEADAAFAPLGDGREPDHTTLAALDLAERSVREALRLHPPGAFGVREAVRDVTAGGYRIPRGTLIAWSPHLAGRDPRCWPDPLDFDPDRHRDPTPEQAAQSRAAWVPFGGGARNCLGFALAQIELTLIVARLAQRLDLAPAGPAVPPPTRRSRPQGGAPLRVTPR